MDRGSFRWSGVTIDCVDPSALVRFWAGLIGGETSTPLPGWRRLDPPGGGRPVITFQPVPEPKAGKTRIHLDLTVDDIVRATETVRRLGGRTSDGCHVYDEGVVLEVADPEGNEFCIVEYHSDGA